MNKIDLGACAEYSFAAELLARGIVPAWPSVETKPYDMIADSSKGLFKIQVKGAHGKGHQVRVTAKKTVNGRGTAYTKEDADIVAVLIFEYELWYLIPIEKVKRDMRIRPEDPACQWRKYQAAWHLIE